MIERDSPNVRDLPRWFTVGFFTTTFAPDWVHALCAFTLLLIAACFASTVRAQCTEHLSPPAALQTADGRAAYVEWPGVLRINGQTTLLGSPAFLWASREVFDSPLNGNTPADTLAYVESVRRNHGLVGFVFDKARAVAAAAFPPGHLLRNVMSVSGEGGVTHVAWAEPNAPDYDVSQLRRLWYASVTSGRWSEPVQIFAGEALDWGGHVGAILSGANGDVHVISAMHRGDTAGIVHLTRHNGHWTEQLVQLNGLPSQVTAQRVGADSLVVAYAGIGDPAVTTFNGQHIYLIRTALDQAHWPPAQRIQWSGVNTVRWLQLHAVPALHAMQLVLVWNAVTRERSAADTLMAWQSADHGVTWRATPPVAFPNRVTALAQAVDSAGLIHVVTRVPEASRGQSQFQHRTLQHGQWSVPVRVYSGPLAGTPVLDATRADTLVFVWSETRPAAPVMSAADAPVTLLATLTKRC